MITSFLGGFGGGKLSPLLRGASVRIGKIFDQFENFFATFALFSVRTVYISVPPAMLFAIIAISPEPFL